jgi:hypothetical protein
MTQITQITQIKTWTDFDVICVYLRDLRGKKVGWGSWSLMAES